ncbi:MAG: adenylyl-sulfate kinase, partial [Nanoarchaeota archaeon]|nr:adenylyl-sulfate kinase [Nanoarchaeota archaeon]
MVRRLRGFLINYNLVNVMYKQRCISAKKNNIVFHQGSLTRLDKCQLLGHNNKVLWFTGLSASGKSTLARAVEKRLHEMGIISYVLDGDNVRHGLNKDLSFNNDDREENIRRIGEVAKLFVDAGLVVGTAFISPYKGDRDEVRELFDEGEFIEVFINAELKTCEKRDVKGLYKKARAGEIKEFTGISAPYEEPVNAEL